MEPPIRPGQPVHPFHLLAKPAGPVCNLDCEYCFFLSKKSLYPGDRFRMSPGALETYIRQLIEAHPAGDVTVAWQGGEPTLMGIEFFRRAAELADRYRRPDQVIRHTIQTNGTLLTADWCEMFSEHRFLVGISVDGPPDCHDRFRLDKRGRPTSERVLHGLTLLQRHGVDFNVLCTVNGANQDRPLDVYRYLRDDLGVRHIQLIPVVEREGQAIRASSVEPAAWGRFLVAVFDEWLAHDVGRVFVQMFDSALAGWCGLPPDLCLFAETCGRALVLEHNGDLYSCDHFVDPEHLLGNIGARHLGELVALDRQTVFGRAKAATLPSWCRRCEFRFACNGECPKNRFAVSPDGEPGLNYLCPGYRAFFHHVDGPMRLMADLLRQGRFADEIGEVFARAGRNQPCPCGSGRKAKHCHQSPPPPDTRPGPGA